MHTLRQPSDIFKDLVSIKDEAVAEIVKMVHPTYLEDIEATGDNVIVNSITISPATSVEDLEEDEVLMELHLTFYISAISSEQIKDLNMHGKITIIDFDIRPSKNSTLWDVRYDTSYCFMLEEGEVMPGSFTHSDEI